MPDRTDHPLFTITDGLDTTYEAFSTRLVHGLLLEPKLVMPDTYFFSSPHLKEHVLKERASDRDARSLFAVALHEKLITPMLRKPAGTFREVLGYLRGQQLQGKYDEEDTEYYAALLSQARDLEDVQSTLPAHSGVGYDELIRRCLLEQQPQGIDPKIWKLTEPLREGISEAEEMTNSRPEGEGLRRGELTRVAGKILGVVDPHGSQVVGRGEILKLYAYKVNGESIRYRAAKEFFDWIYEMHRINMAAQLGVSLSMYATSQNTLAVLQSAVPSILGYGPQGPPRDEIVRTIKIPRVKRLLQWSPSKFIDARDHGDDWRIKVRFFIENPNDETRDRAERALEEYAKKLCKLSPKSDLRDLSVKAFAMQAAPNISAVLLGAFVPGGVFIATGAATGCLAYQYFVKNQPEKVRYSLGPNIIEPSGASSKQT
ncbi:hypothetical protein P3T36_004847 [Kitasatospora sp. MAP12-15]|uniref:hypothetical protein n=1 Tax=unclassified Kitasatospora TaxID=2633591 RepID=UPI002476F13A|nr:hypothetical protein [Kitasatospora sp. MAP12-44]MDH6110221.1 hypothetical protein [Kitasatospora sp. MAP12-44]